LEDSTRLWLLAEGFSIETYMIVRDHVMNKDGYDNREGSANDPVREASSKRKPVDQACAVETIFYGRRIRLGLALGPLLNEASHTVSLKCLHQAADAFTVLELIDQSVGHFGVLGQCAFPRHGVNGVENAHNSPRIMLSREMREMDRRWPARSWEQIGYVNRLRRCDS
jgi:hypothetical protein